MSDTGVYFCDKCNWPEPKCLCVTRPEPPKMVEVKERELATLRTKAAAYEIGMERWCVFSDKGTPIRFFPDQYLWEEPQYASLRKIGFTCRKVKVCEVVE